MLPTRIHPDSLHSNLFVVLCGGTRWTNGKRVLLWNLERGGTYLCRPIRYGKDRTEGKLGASTNRYNAAVSEWLESDGPSVRLSVK